MKTKIERLLKIAVMLVTLAKLNYCQDIIFPDDEEALSHLTTGTPVTDRTKPPTKTNEDCPENMFRWQDKGPRSSWVCECKPRYVYFPVNDSCHEVFERGPCPPLQYVYLAPNQTIASCVPNTCKRDGYVPYRGVCHPLRAQGGPCADDEALNVNEDTLELECLSTDLIPFVIIDAPHRKDGNCPRGKRRSSLGVCKLVL